LKMRAARFLRNSESDRKQIYKFARDLYVLRSKAVHTRKVAPTLHGEPVHEILREGFWLAADTTRRFIINGDPDWEAVTFG
jgi:hypothetical protein